jgi:hypothetical protein
MTFYELSKAMEAAVDKYELLEIASHHRGLFVDTKWPTDARRAREALLCHLERFVDYPQIIDALRRGFE